MPDCNQTCTITVREQEVLFSEVTGPVTQPNGDICYTHISGNPDLPPKDICIPVYEHPPFTASPGNGVCWLGHDGAAHRVGSCYRRVTAGRPPGTAILPGKNPGEPIANTTFCATINVPACGGIIRIDHDHGLTARDGFDSALFVTPQWQVDGGAWTNFNGNRDEICTRGLAPECQGEQDFHDTAWTPNLPTGNHTICVRLLYGGPIEWPFTQGNVTPNGANLHLSVLESKCC